ncbi:response regulator [Desulfurivibrio alkaliphilus]|uniref:Response regulator receiver protein n=1 Tax=Desulfurivibrio alkaliphilus (strain DSM 19089 / UNIQEM U267 / AHT2) TaxID=589865 RepID=D6Z0D6_DESAT|nr:response regulator [Desulfurivibrio alkaliphilus]ADH87169.1 response regulator receiver protein [Desulfurivibrio alkaliphilus AHT 2]
MRNDAKEQKVAGVGLAVFSGDFCRGDEVLAALRQDTGCRVVDDRVLVKEAARLSGMSPGAIERAFSAKDSVFEKFTHEKGGALAWLRRALAEQLGSSGLLLAGNVAHLLPREISHYLRVCLIAELPFRLQQAMAAENLTETEARRRITAADTAKAHWVQALRGHEDPWAAELYDMLLPMAETGVEEAAALIGRQLQRSAVQPTEESRQALADFQLAAQAGVALVEAGHDGEVAAQQGRLTVRITRKVLMFNRLRDEVQAMLGELPGVAEVSVEVDPGVPHDRQAEIYRKHDRGTPSKVLLVDDEREFVQTLSERLLFRDVGAAVAHDGQSALEMLIDDEPEVLVLDLKMPGIDGIEVLRRVKKIRPEVEVIILTGHGSEDDRRTCLELGALAYLRKPVDIDELEARLQEAHQKVQASREADRA